MNIKQNSNSDSTERIEFVRPHVEVDNTQTLKDWLDRGKSWFQSLPVVGQAIVGVVGIFMGFSLLIAVIRLVSFLISIILLGGLLYWGYQILKANSTSN